MEIDTKIKLKEITKEIILLSQIFKRKIILLKQMLKKQKGKNLFHEQGGWGITTIDSGTGSIENTIEIPTAPQTNKGLKFHAAAEELKKLMTNFLN